MGSRTYFGYCSSRVRLKLVPLTDEPAFQDCVRKHLPKCPGTWLADQRRRLLSRVQTGRDF